MDSTSPNPTITVPEMCPRHQSLLVDQARFRPKDPWRALIIISQVALFQAASADPRVQAEMGDDITQIGRIGCLACRKPDSFGEVVEAAKTRDLGNIKALGERWVNAAAVSSPAASADAVAIDGATIPLAQAIATGAQLQQQEVAREERFEAAYWEFDARRKGDNQWKGAPQSERDAFKHTVRKLLG